MPLLPLDQVAFHSETGPLWLYDIEWLQVRPPWLFHEVPVVIVVDVWNGGRKIVLSVYSHNLHHSDSMQRSQKQNGRVYKERGKIIALGHYSADSRLFLYFVQLTFCRYQPIAAEPFWQLFKNDKELL